MKRSLWAVVVLLMGSASAWAQTQTLDLNDRMPRDPEVRIGRLDNGLTYYIRHNAKPKGIGEFRIVHNVGAIQEEDSQVGLAHFLEHMAFNGTKNLPGKMIIEWLEGVGVKFGQNLNAFTGMELTAYEIKDVPLVREGVVDSVLLVLHDWSQFITLAHDEIDNERGVIVEEMRQRNSAQWRIGEKTSPTLFGGTRYGNRNIIGNEKQLRTFPYEEITSFYKRWYRPDLQCVIMVGDFDVDAMETRLKNVMADIPAPVNPEPKQYFPIPGNAEPEVMVVTDSELTGSNATLYIRRAAPKIEDRDKLAVVYNNMLVGVASSMLNKRMANIAMQPDARFKSAVVGLNTLTATNQAFILSVDARENEIPNAFEAAYTELERARRYGFTQAELEIEKANMNTSNENGYAARDDRSSSSFIEVYMGNFTAGRHIASAQHSYEISKQLIAAMTLEQLNPVFAQLITPANRLIVATTPAKEGVTKPSAQELLDAMVRVGASTEISAHVQESISEPLVSESIKPGKVRKTDAGAFGSQVWTLKNGVRVVVKPTKLEINGVNMSAYAAGGNSMLSDEDFRTSSFVLPVIGASGLGKFNRIELSRLTAGRSGNSGPSLGRFSTGIAGGCTTAELELMLQMTWLTFTAPRFEREQFDRIVAESRLWLTNSQNTPQFKFQEASSKAKFGNDPRAASLTIEELNAVDFDRLPVIYDKFYKNTVRNYTFYFVGDFDLEVLRPLVEKYIGGLPTGGTKLAVGKDGLVRRKGNIVDRFGVDMEMPKSTVYYNFTGDASYTLENRMTMILLGECLNRRYIQSIREEKGGTYGVGVRGDVGRQPAEQYELEIMFETDPAMADELMEIVDAELRNIADNGPLPEDVAKSIEFWHKSRPEQLRQNGSWMSYLQTYYTWGEDWATDWESTVDGLGGEHVKAMARKILSDGNLTKVIMEPKEP